jgi:hypothetical protein
MLHACMERGGGSKGMSASEAEARARGSGKGCVPGDRLAVQPPGRSVGF